MVILCEVSMEIEKFKDSLKELTELKIKNKDESEELEGNLNVVTIKKKCWGRAKSIKEEIR